MKICMIFSAPFPPEEGIGNYVNGLSKELLLRGHEIVGITRGGLFKFDEIAQGDLRIIRAPFLPAYPIHVQIHSLAVQKIVKRLEPTVELFHVHSPLSPVPDTKRPIVATFHTMMMQEIKHLDIGGYRNLLARSQTMTFSRRLEKQLLRRSSEVAVVSNEVRESLREYEITDFQNVSVVFNGVDCEKFSQSKLERVPGRLLYTGRLDARKGIFDLIEAIRYIEQNDLELLIVGKGPLLQPIIKRIESWDLKNKIRILGHLSINALIDLYQNTELFILPSRYEGLPTVLLEAMSCGTPCIATSVGGVPDLIENDVDGVLVPPGNPAALGSAIENLHANPKKREALGRKAREKIVGGFSWSSIASRYESIYRKAYEK